MMKKLILITLLLGSMMQALTAAIVTTNRATYTTNEHVRVHFDGMTAKNKLRIKIGLVSTHKVVIMTGTML